MSSLLKSRWAPKPSEINQSVSQTGSPGQGSLLSPAAERARFMKIVARLKWKLPFLAEAYRLATLHTEDPEIDVSHAQIMFKLDFHEYYALLERAIVHLLGVFGISVSGSQPPTGHSSNRPRTHRYHANVLGALEERSSPLHSVLGSGTRYSQLQRAKELRNRWKTADMSAEERAMDDWSSQKGNSDMPLESYDLEEILAEIFDGLEDGYQLAEEHLARNDNANSEVPVGDSAVDWDFIVDAMDWEAI